MILHQHNWLKMTSKNNQLDRVFKDVSLNKQFITIGKLQLVVDLEKLEDKNIGTHFSTIRYKVSADRFETLVKLTTEKNQNDSISLITVLQQKNLKKVMKNTKTTKYVEEKIMLLVEAAKTIVEKNEGLKQQMKGQTNAMDK